MFSEVISLNPVQCYFSAYMAALFVVK